jgi:hypothetical protein
MIDGIVLNVQLIEAEKRARFLARTMGVNPACWPIVAALQWEADRYNATY